MAAVGRHIMNPRDISIRDYTYVLPQEKIAFYPLEERDQSKLLVYRNNHSQEAIFRDLTAFLPAGSQIVFNNTRVVEARLLFTKETGARIEVFCLEPPPVYGDLQQAMQQKGEVLWSCLIGGASKWKKGQVLHKQIETGDRTIRLSASWKEKWKDSFLIAFSWDQPELSFAEILHLAGLIPLPPYIKRAAAAADSSRYQTIYAEREGSVAAPTAGLHFTDTVLENLQKSDMGLHHITLHVGAGTFKPVSASRMEEHAMHAEFIEVEKRFIDKLIQQDDSPVIAVGTTSMRTLESLYWLGCLAEKKSLPEESIWLDQWEPYDHPSDLSKKEALQALSNWMESSGKEKLYAKTQILIVPGYDFKVVDGLITNFHQPESTLLLLVAAFIGSRWKEVYQYALEQDFRFLSYGDACLFFRQ